MKINYDCMPCFIRQTIHAVKFATDDREIHEKVLREVLRAMSKMDLTSSPPEMGQLIHRLIRKHSGNTDPYKEVKDRYNRYALDLYPSLLEILEKSPDRFETSVRLAIAGNIIDFGANIKVDSSVIEETVENALGEKILGDIGAFREAAHGAKSILYLGDNTGEIVFDSLLIRELPTDRVVFAVRGNPVINDATYEDAEQTGMADLVKVIGNGSDAPGTVLKDCSEPFLKSFRDADLIIAKGQGNYETLSASSRPIFFLLKAKCPLIARNIGCNVGDSNLLRA